MKNEPAFPQLRHDAWNELHVKGGMTLRDYFAAKAMQGLLNINPNPPDKELAHFSYQLADAMLKAREQ
jgi:hypothetical protein